MTSEGSTEYEGGVDAAFSSGLINAREEGEKHWSLEGLTIPAPCIVSFPIPRLLAWWYLL